VRALVNIYDRLQKLGIEVDTSDPAEIDKIAHTILQGEWSKAELESYLNRHSGNAVLQSVLKQSQLSPTQQQLIITTRNGSYWETASHTKENADLLEQLVKGHGKLSEGKINTWVKHGACAGGLTRFFRRIGEAFDI
jgi:hypothetical protein